MDQDSLSFVDEDVVQHLLQVERLPIVLSKMLRARLPAILQAVGQRNGLGDADAAQASARGFPVAADASASSVVAPMKSARTSPVAPGANAARISPAAPDANAGRVSPMAAHMDSARISPAAPGANAARISPMAAPMDSARISPAAPGANAGSVSPMAARTDSTRNAPAASNAEAATSSGRLSPAAVPADSARNSPAAVVTESDSSCDDAATGAVTAAGTISPVSTGDGVAKAPATTPTETERGCWTKSPCTSPAGAAAATAIDNDHPSGTRSQFFEEFESGSAGAAPVPCTTPRPLNLHKNLDADYETSRHTTHKRGRVISPSPTPKLPLLTRHAEGAPGLAATGSRRTFPFLLNFPALAPGADIIRVPALRPQESAATGSKKGKDTQVNFTHPRKKSLVQSRDAKGKFRSARKRSSPKGPPPRPGTIQGIHIN